MVEPRISDNDQSKRDIPSFIEPRPPTVLNPFMRPRPQKGTNLMELFEEDSESEEPELVQVYLRLKPYHGQNNLYEVRSDRCLITSVDTATAGHGRRTQHNVSKMYTFSHIFGAGTTQKEIFEQVVKDNLKKLPEGHNFTLLTYGASGSGKTYTLMGTVVNPGLVPRSLEYVFRVVDAAQSPLYKPADGGADKLNNAEQDYELQWVKRLRQISAPLRDKYRRMSAGLCSDFTVSTMDLTNRIQYYVWVSFIEIYNEGIYDLLASSDRRMSSKLKIREDTNGNVYVKGATQAFVRTGEEAYDVMVAGKHNLQVAATGVHAHSSRSHCIFTITMLTETDGGVRTSCVRLCDLAGCERARQTKNTGARMTESRHINSSLHVLERCMHTLRRKQRNRGGAVVPYRESKLTRLLGAGLSGARGEAVSMVVTLNPAPEYAHETRHVLQLAAVAKDIQVNHTIAESILESSESVDTTVATSAEVMKLRAENERLHFELVQAQSRNKELLASMEERQQEAAETMRELVEEAKDMTRQYYEAQMQALKSEMEDMMEEYECRLKKEAAPPSNSGTPSRALQNKVAQLMTDIAFLEEKFAAEQLARARAEQEVQHLRACIEERDENSFENKDSEKQENGIMCESDSELDSEEEFDDPCNESLEPTFKKEDINRSRLIIQTLNSPHHASINSDRIKNIDEENYHNNTDHKTNKTLQNDESIIPVNDTVNDTNTDHDVSGEESNKSKGSEVRGTYFVRKSNDESMDVSREDLKKINSFRGTYFVCNTAPEDESTIQNDLSVTKEFDFTDAQKSATSPEESEENCDLDKSDTEMNSPKNNFNIDHITKTPETVRAKVHKESYFVCNTALEDESTILNNLSVTKEFNFTDAKITAESPKENYNLYQSDTGINSPENNSNIDHNTKTSETVRAKVHTESIVTKIMRTVKSTHDRDSSLTQFEQLEMAANNLEETRLEENTLFSKNNVVKQKKTYFRDSPVNDKLPVVEEHASIKITINKNVKDSKKDDTDNTTVDNIVKGFQKNVILGEKPLHTVGQYPNEELIKTNITKYNRSYFDYDDNKNTNKHIEIVKDINLDVDEDRSPSIVKDVVEVKDFEPTAIKKLLGENLTRQPDAISYVPTNQILAKKHGSVDIFEGFESPHVAKTKELSVIDKARKSIERIVSAQKSASKTQNLTTKEKESIAEKLANVEKLVESHLNIDDLNNITAPQHVTFGNNTTEDFENLYKDITAPNATDFEIIVQEVDKKNENKIDTTKLEGDTITEKSVSFNTEAERSDFEKTKYNLRKQSNKKNFETDEVVLESQAKSESKAKTKRNLRLRKKRNEEDDDDKFKNDKLKDIVNLQLKFSDVTLDVPAPVKEEVADIPSPEKAAGEENQPPLGAQSCPFKSVTRSRRKLFTPRAEPLDESGGAPADSGERPVVPRPSYHRGRARRKLVG